MLMTDSIPLCFILVTEIHYLGRSCFRIINFQTVQNGIVNGCKCMELISLKVLNGIDTMVYGVGNQLSFQIQGQDQLDLLV